MTGDVCPLGYRAYRVSWLDDDGVRHFTTRWAKHHSKAFDWLLRKHPTATERRVEPWFTTSSERDE